MLRSVLTLLPILCVQGLRLQRQDVNSSILSSAPSVEVYVINLESRPDRCKCMAMQLDSAPFPVNRQQAVSMDECRAKDGLHSNKKVMWGTRNHTAEQSLFCSNFQIWKKLESSKAEFAVILEDDAILTPQIWDTVKDYVSSPRSIGFVQVDPLNVKSKMLAESFEIQIHEKAPMNPNDWFWGTHMTIVKRSFVSEMIERARLHGMGTLDTWTRMELDQTKVGLMLANIVHQERSWSARPEVCEGVGTSNIAFQQKTKLLQRLSCPG